MCEKFPTFIWGLGVVWLDIGEHLYVNTETGAKPFFFSTVISRGLLVINGKHTIFPLVLLSIDPSLLGIVQNKRNLK